MLWPRVRGALYSAGLEDFVVEARGALLVSNWRSLLSMAFRTASLVSPPRATIVLLTTLGYIASLSHLEINPPHSRQVAESAVKQNQPVPGLRRLSKSPDRAVPPLGPTVPSLD
jgi:hypothetical protein